MIKYIKENLDSIFKLFINHIGMMIFGLVVLITSKLLSSNLKNDAVYYIMGAITVLMYFSLIYTAMWERGAKDKIKVDGGRAEKSIFHGLLFYLIANIIGVFTGIMSLILSIFVTEDVSFINNTYGVFQIVSHYYNSMYLPVLEIDGLPVVLHASLYVFAIIPGALVSFVSYILGLNGFKCLFPEPKYDKNRKIR